MVLDWASRCAGLLLLLAAVVTPARAQDLVPVPALKARVTDLTHTLTADQTAQLGQKLAGFESRKGSQIVVLIVPTTKPEALEQYSIRVAEQWKAGRKGVDDGAILLVAKDDRALRIEVGDGLEGALPDVTAKRIVSDIIVPRFRAGDFCGGIDAVVDAMIKVVGDEALPAPPARRTERGVSSNLHSLLFIGFIAVFVVGGILRAIFGRLPAAGLIGAGVGAIAWLLLGSLAVALIAGAVGFIFTLITGA